MLVRRTPPIIYNMLHTTVRMIDEPSGTNIQGESPDVEPVVETDEATILTESPRPRSAPC